MNLLAQIICSDLFFFFCDEESSPSDAFTPKKRKTRLAGKMRT